MRRAQLVSGRRAMSVWLAMWSIDLLRRQDQRSHKAHNDTRAILLATQDHQRQIVTQCCERARAAGICPGMPVAQARALFQTHGVRIEAHDPDRERGALRSLAVWAHRLSPVVAMDEPDALLLDVTGCERAFQGEKCLIQTAMDGLTRLGIHARIAIAPTFGCAWAVARFGPDPKSIIAPEQIRGAIATLPIASLRIENTLVGELGEIGIERVEHLLELPRSALPARFGNELLLQLDRALGQAIETIDPVRPLAPPMAERIFDGPTDRFEAIELTVHELLGEIGEQLIARESGARSIRIELVRSDLPPERLLITLAQPSRDVCHLWTLLRPKLERAHLGFGVEAVRVRASSIGRLRHGQSQRWTARKGISESEAARSRDELLDTLSNRLGPSRVLRTLVVESHIPERAFETWPVIADRSNRGGSIVPSDRPTVLFDRPIPAQVITLTPDGPLQRMRWRGTDHAIIASAGLERIEAPWWNSPTDGTRQYLAVQNQNGRWLWVCCENRKDCNARWSVYGVWA